MNRLQYGKSLSEIKSMLRLEREALASKSIITDKVKPEVGSKSNEATREAEKNSQSQNVTLRPDDNLSRKNLLMDPTEFQVVGGGPNLHMLTKKRIISAIS